MARPQAALAVGVSGYNGFAFPYIVQLKIVGTPIEDSAGRATKYVQWTIDANWTHVVEDGPVNTSPAGTAIDNNIERLREVLTAPGRELVAIQQGFGNAFVVNKGMVDRELSSLVVGGQTPILDASYGPKPTFEAWTPVGSNRATHINWSCVVTLPQDPRISASGVAYKDKLSEWTYSARWSIDQSRMTTRTISGTIEIPVTRKSASSREIQNTVDAFREKVKIPEIPGFHRVDDYGMSSDKRRLEFSVIDSEIASNNEYFPGMIKMDITHGVSTNLKEAGFRSWANTLAGSVEVVPGAPMSLGWVAIQAVINQRLKAARDGKGSISFTRKVQNPKSTSTKSSAITIISALSIQEALFGRTIGFSLTYMVTTDLKTLIEATGLFKPLGIGKWDKWTASLKAITGVRGYAALSHSTKDDVILDLGGGTIPTQVSTPRQVAPSTSPVPGINTGTPGVSDWLVFVNRFSVRSETNVVILNSLTASLGDAKTVTAGLKEQKVSDLARSKKGTTLFEKVASIVISPIIQARSPQTYTLVMQGFATKVGFDFPIPSVVKVGGVDAIKKSDPITEERTTADMQGQILYSKKWRKEYILDGKPEGEIDKTLETDGIPTDIPT